MNLLIRIRIKTFLTSYLDRTFGILPNMDEKVYDIEIEFAGSTGQYISLMNWHKSQRLPGRK
jgi:hypothetical protein